MKKRLRKGLRAILVLIIITAVLCLWMQARRPFVWIRLVDWLPIPGAWKMWLWGWR